MTGPSNPHLLDPNLRPFLAADFSPTQYLNTHLPSPPSGPAKTQQQSQSLATFAAETQSHIAKVNAQQTRISAVLTELTDDILRTSSRLAYEVELLRGEAVSLSETLSSQGPLREAIERFVPDGLPLSPPSPTAAKTTAPITEDESALQPTGAKEKGIDTSPINPHEPPALSHLRTLHHVRTQLQHVIQTFNLALSFPLPPSLLATPASAILSIQSPNTDPDAESKGQAALSKLKTEITDLLRSGEKEKAQQRVRQLREICGVWKGTNEEKARLKWVEGLELLVGLREEEREREKDMPAPPRRPASRTAGLRRDGSAVRGEKEGASRSGTPSTGAGFLRRLRDEIYLDSS